MPTMTRSGPPIEMGTRSRPVRASVGEAFWLVEALEAAGRARTVAAPLEAVCCPGAVVSVAVVAVAWWTMDAPERAST